MRGGERGDNSLPTKSTSGAPKSISNHAHSAFLEVAGEPQLSTGDCGDNMKHKSR